MKIIRSLLNDGHLAPSAVNYLINIPDAYLHHEKHGLRHPFSIYHVSLKRVTDAFEEVIQRYHAEVRIYSDKGEVKHYKNLLRAQRDLLYSLREHIDDCYSVFKTLIDPSLVPKKIIFTDKYLVAAKFKEIGTFNGEISYYKDDYLSPLVNSLKHGHARLQGLYFHTSDEIRIGYYLEEMGRDGVVGPSVRVHRDGNSAFSLSRDIIFNLTALYHVSEKLVDSLKRYLGQNYSFNLLPLKQDESIDVKQMIESAYNIEQKFFPDELMKPCAKITLESDNNDSKFTLVYPSTPEEASFPEGLKMACFMEPDSKSKIFKLPYVGRRNL